MNNEMEELVEQGTVPPSNPPPPPSSSSSTEKQIPVKKLTPEEFRRLAMNLEKLKQQGIDPSDPRIAPLVAMLKMQVPLHNPNHPPSAVPATSSQTPAAAATAAAVEPKNLKISMTSQQLVQLKAQILAFKYLSRNITLPPKLLEAIKSFSTSNIHQHLIQQLQHHITHPTATPPTPVAPQNSTPKASTTPVRSTTVVPPSSTTTSTPSSAKTTAFPLPPIEPEKVANLPIQFVLQEREKRIKAKMSRRIEELLNLPADISKEMKTQALIELKQLKLLELQKKLRNDLVVRVRRLAEIESAMDTSAYKKTKKTKLDLKGMGEGFTGGVMDEQQLKKQKQSEFLSAVIEHSKKFKEHHANNNKKKKKICRDLLSYHANEEKRIKQEQERQRKALLQALKEENEPEYLKYIEEAKNERLSELLRQTDEFLGRIGVMIQEQKERDDIVDKKKEMEEKAAKSSRSRKKKKGKDGEDKEDPNAPADGKEGDDRRTEDMEEEEDSIPSTKRDSSDKKSSDSSNSVEQHLQSSRQYYTIAHSIQEKIIEQPEMLKGGKLKSYQLTGVQWLLSLYNNKLNGILADEMGLGKTIQTIALLAYLMEKKGNNGPFFIVVPLSTISNWALEFGRWAPSMNVVIYKGKPATRKQIFKEELAGAKFNVLLSSFEYVMIDKADLSKIEWEYIILDEGHRIKNRNSKLSNVLRQYLSRHRLLLTGTPLQNDLGELWSLLNFLLPNIFNSAENFETWFNAPFSFASNKKKPSGYIQPNETETLLIINRLHKVLRPFLLRRLKQEVESELPDKVECLLKCDLSALQRRMYKNMVEKGVMLCDPETSKGKRKKGFNNTIMQLQKICNHPYLFRDEWHINDDLIRSCGKFELLDRILPKFKVAGHRVLIFNQMTHLMTIMEDFFKLRGFDYLRLDGGTKSEERSQLVQIWNDPKSPHWLFILSTKAGGLGLNLQTADTVIIFDTDWNPQMDLQAQDRAHRIGQSKEVRVFRLVSHNTVEEKILEKANFKLDVDAKVIEAGMFNTHANDKMRRAMLESLLRDSEDREEAELLQDDEHLNEVIARNEEEFAFYMKFDQERKEEDLQIWKKSGNKGPLPPRLMSDDELPDWIKVDIIDEDILTAYGRGQRERPEVSYKLPTEKDLLLSGTRKRKSEPAGNQTKKPKIATKSSNKSSTSSPSPFQPQFAAILDRLQDLKDPSTGRHLTAPFMKLPSKREYPQYYSIIKRPISINKIRSSSYSDPIEFKSDFITLVRNAMMFNTPGSDIYNDAAQLEKLFLKEYEKHFKKDGGDDDAESGDGEEEEESGEEEEEEGAEESEESGDVQVVSEEEKSSSGEEQDEESNETSQQPDDD